MLSTSDNVHKIFIPKSILCATQCKSIKKGAMFDMSDDSIVYSSQHRFLISFEWH